MPKSSTWPTLAVSTIISWVAYLPYLITGIHNSHILPRINSSLRQSADEGKNVVEILARGGCQHNFPTVSVSGPPELAIAGELCPPHTVTMYKGGVSSRKNESRGVGRIQNSHLPAKYVGGERFSISAATRHTPRQWWGRFLGIIGWDPSVRKSNRLHVDILRFSFIKLGCYIQ